MSHSKGEGCLNPVVQHPIIWGTSQTWRSWRLLALNNNLKVVNMQTIIYAAQWNKYILYNSDALNIVRVNFTVKVHPIRKNFAGSCSFIR